MAVNIGSAWGKRGQRFGSGLARLANLSKDVSEKGPAISGIANLIGGKPARIAKGAVDVAKKGVTLADLLRSMIK